MTWNPAALPPQHGRVFVVTGGNAGLGYFTAEQLARTGARVVLASRSRSRADAATAAIVRRVPAADLDVLPLDLASLESVRAAAAELAGWERLDGLVLNGGMTHGPRMRRTTADGNELVLGTNFLGHFALVAGAWPALERSRARVVGLASLATLIVPLDASDLASERRYGFFRAYGFSKHAMLGFTLELARRSAAITAVAADPGYSISGLTPARDGVVDPTAHRADRLLAFGAQGKNRGAAPTVRALLDPAVRSGDYVRPQYLTRGRPVVAHPRRASTDPRFGERLWPLAEEWTETRFEL